ncbi:hypothetical protein BDZ97DRAFT_1073982 [Flammula alnicola]|nr:hypothetical protein BDZ97DRAFT_1073982 [Flammula alnicola]
MWFSRVISAGKWWGGVLCSVSYSLLNSNSALILPLKRNYGAPKCRLVTNKDIICQIYGRLGNYQNTASNVRFPRSHCWPTSAGSRLFGVTKGASHSAYDELS